MAGWGPIQKDTTTGRAIGEEGAVTQPHVNGGSAPRHPTDYDATDGRHNREAGLRPWASIDHFSGPTSDTDFGNTTGSFEDGPGVWRQT